MSKRKSFNKGSNSNGNKGNRSTNNSRKCYNNSGSNRFRSNKPNYNDPSQEDMSRNSSNDPRWYGADYAILKDAASINYSIPAGSPLRELYTSESQDRAFPGLLALYTCSGIGLAKDPSAPINVASNSVYSFVRHANSGHSNYDAPDLMIYLLAMSQVYAYINFLTRAYALSTLYGQKNRYYPDCVMQSMNIDPNDVRKNGAQFRYGINVLVNKAASFAVPNNMPYFSRESFLYSGVYTEGESFKDQMYILNPYAFLQYGIDSADSYGCLDYKIFRTSATKFYTVTELIDFGNSLIDPLIASEDMGIMSGDILKAYGQESLVKLASVTENLYVVPEFNITVLEQIKNARAIGMPKFDKAYSSKHAVDQKSKNLNAYLVSCPCIEPNAGPWNDTLFVNNPIVLTTSTAEPDVDVTIENTRFATPFFKDGDNYLAAYASDFVVDTTAYTAAVIKSSGELAYGRTEYQFVNTTDVTTKNTDQQQLAFYNLRTALGSHFDFLPLRYEVVVFNVPNIGDEGTIVGVPHRDVEFVGDTDNFALVSGDTMYRMNEAALLNLLHVDTIAKLG